MLTWDITVASMLAASFDKSTSRSAGAAECLATIRKSAEYANLESFHYIHCPAPRELRHDESVLSLGF